MTACRCALGILLCMKGPFCAAHDLQLLSVRVLLHACHRILKVLGVKNERASPHPMRGVA